MPRHLKDCFDAIEKARATIKGLNTFGYRSNEARKAQMLQMLSACEIRLQCLPESIAPEDVSDIGDFLNPVLNRVNETEEALNNIDSITRTIAENKINHRHALESVELYNHDIKGHFSRSVSLYVKLSDEMKLTLNSTCDRDLTEIILQVIAPNYQDKQGGKFGELYCSVAESIKLSLSKLDGMSASQLSGSEGAAIQTCMNKFQQLLDALACAIESHLDSKSLDVILATIGVETAVKMIKEYLEGGDERLYAALQKQVTNCLADLGRCIPASSQEAAALGEGSAAALAGSSVALFGGCRLPVVPAATSASEEKVTKAHGSLGH